MHSLLASLTWKQLGYAEKVKNDQVILRVLNLIQYNMTNAELLSRQYWIFTNTALKSCKKICLSLGHWIAPRWRNKTGFAGHQRNPDALCGQMARWYSVGTFLIPQIQLIMWCDCDCVTALRYWHDCRMAEGSGALSYHYTIYTRGSARCPGLSYLQRYCPWPNYVNHELCLYVLTLQPMSKIMSH